MFRFRTIIRFLFYVAAVLVFLVFILQVLAPSANHDSTQDGRQRHQHFHFFPPGWSEDEASTTTVFIPPRPLETETMPSIRCRETLVTVEQYRTRSITRAVIVRFPSVKSQYFFVQFRWFYRSWIESETFSLEHWRSDLIVIIDESFPRETRESLIQLNCTEQNRRTNRREISRCILVEHHTLEQRSEADRQKVFDKFPVFNRLTGMHDQLDRLLAMYELIQQFNHSETTLYNFVMITTTNSFITTQFGKYIPVKCAFLIGAPPDYSSFYGKTDRMLQLIHALLLTTKDAKEGPLKIVIDYNGTIEQLRSHVLLVDKQLDIPCDSTKTTYRTSIYQIKCYAHSTSLFSERMFRENAYDGYEKQPFNIYIAREYATLMALQSKVLSLAELQRLAMNVTHRDTTN